MNETKLRKYEHMLVISGWGVIAFGIWSVIKGAIYFIVMPANQMSVFMSSQNFATMQSVGISENVADYIMAGVIMFVLLLDLWLRYFIGRSAIRDGRRIRRTGPAYIILAGLLGLSLISSTLQTFFFNTENTAQKEIMSTASVSVIVDMTSLLALIQMIVAAIMVRRLRKVLEPDRREVA